MVSKRVNRKIRRESRGFVEFVQRRRIGKLRDIFTGDHALHQRIDHDAAAFGGNSAIGETRSRRWRPAKDHAIHPVHDRRPLHFSGISTRNLIPASGSLSRCVAGNFGDDIGIVARLPAALAQAWKTFVPSGGAATQVNPMVLVLMILFLFCVIAGVIAITQGVRKITVQYAKRVVGRKQYGGNTQYMPLKVNYPGVMPIIFAWALLLFPNQIVSWAFPNSPTARQLSEMLSTGWLHYVVLAAMIFFFSYFWVATQFQPSQIADDLKKYGGYIPGVRPGKPTADFLDYTMTRLTFAGAIFLTLIAVLPSLLSQGLHVPTVTAQFFGGTSLLIIVGVMLDTMRQVETHLIQRHYDGFLRKGRVRGGFTGRSAYVRGEAAAQRTLMWLYVGIAIIVIGGVAAFLASK